MTASDQVAATVSSCAAARKVVSFSGSLDALHTAVTMQPRRCGLMRTARLEEQSSSVSNSWCGPVLLSAPYHHHHHHRHHHHPTPVTYMTCGCLTPPGCRWAAWKMSIGIISICFELVDLDDRHKSLLIIRLSCAVG